MAMRSTGVTARGIISPIFKAGDDLAAGVCSSVLQAAVNEGYPVEDGDIIGITESVLARTQGNYASCEAIATDVRAKFGGGTVGIVFPIFSRNRFALLLKGIARGCERLVVQLSYPADEVGNRLLETEQIEAANVNPYSDSFNEAEFRGHFGMNTVHHFTGVDYIEFYKTLGDNIEIVFSNDPAHILNYSKDVICCDIHTRFKTKATVLAKGGQRVLCLDEILTQSIDGSGYNTRYGLLGSNMATEDSVKLFPRDCDELVQQVQQGMLQRTGKHVEVMVYGDGAFKDPVGGIWELADPVVSPAYTSGLSGTPNELKIKYFADNEMSDLSGEELAEAMRKKIGEKGDDLSGSNAALGTTPRRYPDLIGSLCDLVSGSGDRGTPIVYIKGYFHNFASK